MRKREGGGEPSQVEKANSLSLPTDHSIGSKGSETTAALCVIENAPATHIALQLLSLSRQRVERLMHAISRLRKCMVSIMAWGFDLFAFYLN